MKKLLIMAALALLPLLAEAQNNQTHKVKRGETIYGIAHSHGITEAQLRSANPGMESPDYVLKNGSVIIIPDPGTVSVRPVWAQDEPMRRGTNRSTNNRSNTNQPAATSLCPDGNHPHVIDLGLPSGTKWACCNVGGSQPEDYGSYFAWGETTTKNTYEWSTYRWCRWCDGLSSTSSGFKLKKYNYMNFYGSTVDDRTQLELDDDAARANWHGSWRMPTKAELGELMADCNHEWTTVNGVKGYKFTSRSNGHSIFLPAAGYRDSGQNDAGSWGFYWSSTLYMSDPNHAEFLYFRSGGASTGNSYHGRDNGLPVRPVR